jgi:hypothetical protein
MFKMCKWALMFLMAGYASASTFGVPNCSTATLFDYQVTPAAPCAQGILEFSAFSLNSFSVPDETLNRLQVAQEITVTPNGSGFDFSSPLFAVGEGQSSTFEIVYSDLVDPAPIEVGARLDLDPPYGGVTVTQTYSTPPCLTSSVSQSVNVLNPVSSIFFPCALTQGTIQTDIFLDGPAGFDSVGSELILITAPEPSVFWLLGTGLAFMFFLRKGCSRIQPSL